MDRDNTKVIADSIFSRPPGIPGSIQLQLEEQTADLVESDPDIVFKVVYWITYHGIKTLYGGDTDLLSLSEHQYNVVNKYTRSYGYDLNVFANDSDKTPWEIINRGDTINNYRIYFDPI
jgi:hypothetical protein